MNKPTKEQVLGWIEKHFSTYKMVKNDEVVVPNPYYHNDNLKLSISLSKALCHDWRTSDFDMPFVTFVAKFKNIPWREAYKEVTNISYIPTKKQEEEIDKTIQLPENSYPITDNSTPIIRNAVIQYMAKRGLNYERLEKYHIYYNLSPVVIFPFIEFGEMIYWQSRSIIDKVFDFPKGTNKSDYLFGIDHCDFKSDLIICESATNVMSIDYNSVATGGASLGDEQVKKIKILNSNRIILAPDNDDAGKTSLKRNFYKLKPYFKDNIYYIVPLDKRDWNKLLVDGVDVKNYILENIKKLTLSDIVKLSPQNL